MARITRSSLAQQAQQQQAQAVNNNEKPTNQFYMNLGFTMKDGTFVRLSNAIVVALDPVLTESKNIKDPTTDWAKQQKIRNSAIAELQQICEQLEAGDSATIAEFETKILNRLTFEIRHRGEQTSEVSADSVLADDEIEDLLG